MKKSLPAGLLMLLTVCLLFLSSANLTPARAEELQPDPPKRTLTLVVDYTRHLWWVARWSDGEIRCRIFVEYEGLPRSEDIKALCGREVYNEWMDSKPCPQASEGGDVRQCPGLYLQYLYTEPAQREVHVDLPLPTVWLSLANCNPEPGTNRCTTQPYLRLEGEEPLPNEVIIRVQGRLDGEPFSCEGGVCEIPLPPSKPGGLEVVFWADSSFGDASQEFEALVRVQPWGNFMDPDGVRSDPTRWYVNVLSSQWRGEKLPSCSEVWQVFPDVAGPPAWLTTPLDVNELATYQSYYYLAGAMIANGLVDASGCEDGGLQAPRVANACGVEAAMDAVLAWQNQFDAEIMQVAQESGVPAHLLKNVFSRESQLWPGLYLTYKEAGLGQLTENGADTVLLWNPSFFSQFCPLVLSQETCDLGWGNLKEEQQVLLRGALVTQVNAACPDCPLGIDLTQANYSVNIFAQSLIANCEQVGRIIYNITGKFAGQVSTYVELWKFTLANYNAGSGCFLKAFKQAWQNGDRLTWENIQQYLDPACQLAIEYVADISSYPVPTPVPTSWLGTPGAQPTLRLATSLPVTPTPTPGGSATLAPQPTATPGGYPGGAPQATASPTATNGGTYP